MTPLDDTKRRRIARALWAYSNMPQGEFAAAAGIDYNRLRAALNNPRKSPPTTDELIAMSDVAGVPRTVALDGFEVADPLAQLQRRVDELEHKLDRIDACLVARAVARATPRIAGPRGSREAPTSPGRRQPPKGGRGQ